MKNRPSRFGAAELPGPLSADLCRREARWLAPGVQQIAILAGAAIDHGEGAILWDVDGNAYIDFVAGVCVNSIGHAHPKYVAALGEQLSKVHAGSYASRIRVELLELLAELVPFDLNRLQLFSGGSEAIEAAFRLAKSATGHYECVGFWGGFHGKTAGALGVLGGTFKHGLGPLAPGTYLSPYPDPYRCPLGDVADREAACVEFLQRKLDLESTGQLAAIIVEPAQGTGGNVFPSPGFLPRLKQIAQERGALLIVDEMITGFGRTGRMFGLERDLTPADAITIGKGFGGGFPVSGLLTTSEHCQAQPFAAPSGSSSSYGGNPLACAAALASIRVILDEQLVENSRRMGARLLSHLKPFVERYPFVGFVDGEGLMIRVELVADKASKRPLETAHCHEIFKACLHRGLLTMAYAPSVRINPPLVIDEELVDHGAAILKDVFDWFNNKYYAGRTQESP